MSFQNFPEDNGRADFCFHVALKAVTRQRLVPWPAHETVRLDPSTTLDMMGDARLDGK